MIHLYADLVGQSLGCDQIADTQTAASGFIFVSGADAAQRGSNLSFTEQFFYGGFDLREVMDDTSLEAGFLAFMYPVHDAADLKKKLGAVDFA